MPPKRTATAKRNKNRSAVGRTVSTVSRRRTKGRTISRTAIKKETTRSTALAAHSRHVRRIQHAVLYAVFVLIHFMWTFFGYVVFINIPATQHAIEKARQYGLIHAPQSVLAADTGYIAASTITNSGCTLPSGGNYTDDSPPTTLGTHLYQCDSDSNPNTEDNVILGGYSFGLTAGSTIDGIVVHLNDVSLAATGTGTQDLKVRLSWDGGTTWTETTQNSSTNCTTGDISSSALDGDEYYCTGESTAATSDPSSATTWGRTWTTDELSSSNFKIQVVADNSNTTARIQRFDVARVKVFYTVPADPTWSTGAADFEIWESSSTTWDAGTLVCGGTLTDTNASTINCSSNAVRASTQYRVQTVLKNAGGTALSMGAINEGVAHYAVKGGWAGTSPTLGNCAFNDVGADDTTPTCSVAFSGNNVAIARTAGTVTIAATTGTEGFSYLITTGTDPSTSSTSYWDVAIDSLTEDSSTVSITADTTAPTITSISSDKANGSYKAGEVIDIDVTFAEAVTSTGNVTVTLETGVTDQTCTFTVSNATTGTCNYTVQAGDTSSDLDATISGTIKDQAGNAMSNYTPGTGLAANKALIIDTTAPTISSVAPLLESTINNITSASDVSYTLSEAVASGSITMTRTAGTADASSPRTCTLVGTALNSGAHNAFDMSNTTNGCSVAQSLVDGAIYTFAFNATDAAGNAATTVTRTDITFDSAGPTVSVLSPADNATGVSVTANLVMTFNETVLVNTGNVVIKKTSDNSTVETIDITSGQVTGSGTDTITINPSVTLAATTEYYVQPAAGTLVDGAGNSYAGIADTTSWSFTTEAANTAPTGTITSATADTDGTGGVVIVAEVDDADDDDTKIKLEYDTDSTCDGTWNDATITGSATADFNDSGGAPNVDNGVAYQIGPGTNTRVITSSGSNTITFEWDSATDIPTGNTTVCLRLTVNDDTADQATPDTETVAIDNVDPATPGNLTNGGASHNAVTLTYGSQTSDTNLPGTNIYKVFYKAAASGVTEGDTEKDSTDFDSVSYAGNPNITVTGLAASTQYVFNIWAYDTKGNKSNATEIAITTAATPTPVNFTLQTGYYVGDGTDSRSLPALGWSPDFVMIKDDSSSGSVGAIFKTSSMSGETTAMLGEPNADSSSNMIQSLDATGFTVGSDTDVNASNIRFTWTAFDGSTCTTNGTFCVGSYTGDGNATKAIATAGFQPDLVLIKSSGATDVVFRTSDMAVNATNFFGNTVEDTTGAYVRTLDAQGFTVGNSASVNTNGTTYWFIAYKNATNIMKVGTYTGNGTDNTSITGVGFQPDVVFVKNQNTASTAYGVFNQNEHYGDYGMYFLDAGNQTDMIQKLEADGFQIGLNQNVNENTKTYFYAAFGGATDPTPSGTYTMAAGSYTGTGSAQSISGVGFQPDLIIIKGETTQSGVFRTRMMAGDTAGYTGQAGTNFTGAITSIDADGFSVGTSATTNSSGVTYHWQAFGNAFNPMSNSGAADFTIGSYMGNTIDDRNITRIGFQPDLVFIKNSGIRAAIFRTSAHSGDIASNLSATADSSNMIQSFASDGYQIGSGTYVGISGALHHWFAFKESANFDVGTYTGTAAAHDITSVGFNPDLVWVKNPGAYNAVSRPTTMLATTSLPFSNTTSVYYNRITDFVSSGFTVGTDETETNTNLTEYYYAAWNDARSGNLVSASIDTDSYPTIKNKNALRLFWTQTLPSGCNLWLYARGTNTGPTPDYSSSTWSGPYSASAGSATGTQNLAGISPLQGKRYFQYKAFLKRCNSGADTPQLHSVGMEFD